MARDWVRGDRTSFFALVAAEAFEAICRKIMAGLSLQRPDAEDCVAQALEAFLERQDLTEISDPYAYLSRSAWNFGATLHRDRRTELVQSVEAVSSGEPEEETEELVRISALVPNSWAIVAVEEAVDDIEAEESWAVVVVEAALERLTAKQRALIRYISHLDFDFSRKDFHVQSQHAAEALDMTPVAFRKAKQRAYEALRLAIPAVLEELRIQPPTRFASAFDDRPRPTFACDDEGEPA